MGEGGYGAKSFKRWSKADLEEAVRDANADGLLTDDEAVDFVGYWTQKTASGKYLFWSQKTWDTRRRMNNAFRLIYEKHRKAPEDKPGFNKWDDPTDPLDPRYKEPNVRSPAAPGGREQRAVGNKDNAP